MNLKAYQEELKELIFFRDPEKSHSRLWTDGIPARLDVYRNNTRTNWADTLDHDFPMTRQQFSENEWANQRKRFFIKHPPGHWELNASVAPFTRFLQGQKLRRWIQEIADYEWNDLKVFIDRSSVARGAGVTNPTAVIRAYEHQIFFWAEAGAPPAKPPRQKPEVLVFYRDSRNTTTIREADPLMILLMEHFQKAGARLDDLEPIRQKLLPQNDVPLAKVLFKLKEDELIL